VNITASETKVGGEIVVPPRRRRRVPAALAWILVIPCAALAIIRLTGLEGGSVLVPFVTATPFAAVASLVALVPALLARKRAVGVVALLTAVAFAVSVLPRALGSPAGAAPGVPLKVLSANLLFGHADATVLAGLVRRLDPDVLVTQELTPRAIAALDAAGLDELMPHRVLQPRYGAGGSGTYAKHPLTEVPDLVPVISHNMPVVRMKLPSGPEVEIINVHTVAPLAPRSISEWAEGLRTLPSAPSSGPLRIIAGDFNATLDHAELRKVIGRGYVDAADATGGGLVPTWPNGRRPPFITIDHVLADRRAEVARYEVHDVPDSDHRPIYAELRLPVS
jgi:endonuclease/exonuclease/phosphatase (EEP) superfamily protein YafD